MRQEKTLQAKLLPKKTKPVKLRSMTRERLVEVLQSFKRGSHERQSR